MPITLEEYHSELLQDVLAGAHANAILLEEEFFSRTTRLLVDAGEIETADPAPYRNPSRGLRVDGYGGDPLTEDGVLSLISLDFVQSGEISSLTNTDMQAAFRRMENYLRRSLDSRFRDQLEETDPGFGLADLIANRWDHISRVKLFLVSNRLLSSRVDGRDDSSLNDIPIGYSVWDLSRLHRYATSSSEREDVIVNLHESGGPLLVLPAHMESASYEAYLAVVPGSQLAAIYAQWGTRLLEQNVRVFLQARGKVNRGIRNTIEQNPEMFFAYNNGITATAEGVEIADTPEGKALTSIRNFQVVNGGQTTASIYAALRSKDVDLDRVFVQMKLSIVDPKKAVEIVPKISEYANTQNRVNPADFFANHPYHVRMEGFSRRLFAPAADGSFRESKWFYERARGQHQDERARGQHQDERARGQHQDERGYLSAQDRRRFDLTYPKLQVFTKTDLAKFENVWRGKPEIVSRGAQKNFADFASHIGSEWNRHEPHFNELYYRTVIAKAIVFREVERIVSKEDWYQRGFRANIVAYAIAKLGHEVSQRNRVVNFEAIWRAQQLSPAIREALTSAAKIAHDIIVNPPPTMRNVTEWAKQQACWNRVLTAPLELPEQFQSQLLRPGDVVEAQSDAAKDQRMDNRIGAQTAVVNAGPVFWGRVFDWGTQRQLLSPDEQSILTVAMSMPSKVPSENQCTRLLEILSRLQEEGFPERLDGS